MRKQYFSELKIRDTIVADADRVAAIRKKIWLETYAKYDGIKQAELNKLFENNVERIKIWQERLAKVDGSVFSQVIELEGKIVGYVYAYVEDNEVKLKKFHIEEINTGMGYGSLAMRNLMKWADNRLITLHVARDNKRAIRFYNKFGFNETINQITGKTGLRMVEMTNE